MFQRLLSTATLIAALALAAPGCGNDQETASPLGQRGIFGYHIQAGASALLRGGDIGYLITANGAGGYRLVWTDTAGSPAQFTGNITTDGVFDPTQMVNFNPGGNARVTTNGASEIDFASVPGANLDGVDFVTSAEPIYLNAMINGTVIGTSIFFTGAQTNDLLISAFDPVSFTSP